MKQVISLVVLGLLYANTFVSQAGAQCEEQGNDNVQVGVVQSGRIINGIGVKIDRYKFALSLRSFGQHACGASIITHSHALTAAKCVYHFQFDVSRVNLYAGSTSALIGGILIPVDKIVVHPDYKSSIIASNVASDFDVAVLTVPLFSFVGRPNMAPIALQTFDVKPGTLCHVIGWGQTIKNGPMLVNELRYASMRITSQTTCARLWSPTQLVVPNMICAKYCLGVDVCTGDNGNALVCNGKLTGIVSNSNRDCGGAKPAIFIRTEALSIRLFIQNNIQMFGK
ncbi:trypsin 3A1-like [Anopheles merus]|uniref:trypsin 3A1-like n=1 Tax=Anopheles merus TaxID=30066 RepID=UPI001BE49F5B|nr:trypsin 3A1-like [Anopheles merus]